MSFEERNELGALVVWLKTFPQIDQFAAEKENTGSDYEMLSDSKFGR